MRAGAYTIQQTLTAEAASVLKHSLGLARRRGHAQVTPLHVAATLLSSRSSVLRRACIKSQQQQTLSNSSSHQFHHPLQCRALELCFNVALNRLPTSPSSLLHYCQETLSNALIAALKRAQAHQRRGCIEQQQQNPQSLLAVKVELEQLVISILDDPSVSRVMREAGFSSSAVKSNIEDTASPVFHGYSGATSGGGGVFSSPSSPTNVEYAVTGESTVIHSPGTFWQTQTRFPSQPHFSTPAKTLGDHSVSHKEDDLKLILEVLLRKKRRNVVVVGDSPSATDGLVMELMGRVERGEVPGELKSASIIKFHFAPLSFRYMKSSDVCSNVVELKRKIDDFLIGGGGAIIYAGDLTWAGEDSCSAVDDLISEIAKLLSSYEVSPTGVASKVWLMGTSNLQTYMRCQRRKPPLELEWGVQAVSVPSGGLGLTLQAHAPTSTGPIGPEGEHLLLDRKPLPCKDVQLTCCAECTSNYHKEAAFFTTSAPNKLFPSWLLPHATHQQEDGAGLKLKWNRLCQGLHQNHASTQRHSWWPLQTGTLPDANSSITFANQIPSTVGCFHGQQSSTIEFDSSFWAGKNPRMEPNLDSLRNSEGKEVKITLSLGNSLFSDSGKLAEYNIERMLQRGNARRLLQDNVPWQSETIPAIVDALFDMKFTFKDTWLLVHGNDTIGKRRLAHAIAKSVFGSSDLVITLNMRGRYSIKSSYSEIFRRISRDDEKLVVLVENFDMAGKQLVEFLSERFEMGKTSDSGQGKVRDKGQVVYILTKDDPVTAGGDDQKSQKAVVRMSVKVMETTPTTGIDLKRKYDWEFSDKVKVLKSSGKVNRTVYSSCILNNPLSKQSGYNIFDLNEKAIDDVGELSEKDSPNSSDLTGESGGEVSHPNGFLVRIENRFTFNRSLTRDREMKELFLSKLRGSLEEVYGGGEGFRFHVEEGVLEGIVIGAGGFLNGLFEQWLKETFQTAMHIVKRRGREMEMEMEMGGGISISLGLVGDKGGGGGGVEGYMNTCLPNTIHIPSGN